MANYSKTKEEQHPNLLVTIKLLETPAITILIKNRDREELIQELQPMLEDSKRQLVAWGGENKFICFNKTRLEYYTIENYPR